MTKIGFAGCGNISGIYLDNITNVFKELEIVGIVDLERERAQSTAEKYNVKKVYNSVQELLADSEVDIVLNITRPSEHFDVTMAALEAGKHVYTEKPLGASLEEARKIIESARAKNLVIGGAPDTFLGAGLQTCRKLIDDGFIGDVFGASAYLVCRGPESWHPDPEFYYKHGGGPMMDMGPYYLTALVSLLGAVKTVTGISKASLPERTITSKPLYGKKIKVDVSTYITGTMNFHNNAIATIFTTFDVHTAQVPHIEIYGSEGTLCVPDPNFFDGPVRLYRANSGGFAEIPLLFDYSENSRGLGIADMAKAIETGRSARASGNLMYHIVEIIENIERASTERKFIDLESFVERPKPMVIPPIKGILD